MTLSLTERRALLSEAARGGDAEDLAVLARALKGANEEDRTALAKTLPPSRLFKAEGPTPRACFALAALGKPKLVAETACPWEQHLAKKFQPQSGAIAEYLAAAAQERDEPWLLTFIDELAAPGGYLQDLSWDVTRRLIAARGLKPRSQRYLTAFIYRATFGEGPGGRTGQALADFLRQVPTALEDEFWALFQVEGVGGNHLLTSYAEEAWNEAVLVLSREEPGFRGRALDESIGALLRDFPAASIPWYGRVHRLLDPNVQEVAARQHTYLAVLGAAPSTAVGLAQDMLARAVKAGAADIPALIEASPGVLARTEKKLLKEQLKLLAGLKTDASQRERISRILAEAQEGMPLDLAALARQLIVSPGEAAPVRGEAHEADGRGEAVAVAVSEPRRSPLRKPQAEPDPIRHDAELFTLVAEQLEGGGQGAELFRIFDYLATRPEMAWPSEMRTRAAQVIESVWDPHHASPRRLLAAVCIGQAQAEFRGYPRFVVARKGEPDPAGVQLEEQQLNCLSQDPETGEWKVAETWQSRSGYRYLPTHSPLALLAGTFRRLYLARSQGQPFSSPAVVPARQCRWERHVVKPGEGTFGAEVFGDAPKPFWLAAGVAAAARLQAGVDEWVLDVSGVPAEFTFRAQEAREQDGYEQIVQWTARLLQNNPDTLAAQFHPALLAAVQVVNVRGLGAVLAALGVSRQVPGGPVYSALALAASAKMAEQRAQAAEAIASLVGSGLLDPASFATQIGAHVADDFAMAGRIAQTLADTASISALAGYRVLQTLAALMPHLMEAGGKPLTQAGKLVELAARLSADYGTPVELPTSLAARRKGSSAWAVAVRALEAVQPRSTSLVEEAAAAARILEDESTG